VLPRAAGFWLVAGVFFLLLFSSAAASPLYRVYQAQWRFSATTLTAVFAVYVLVLPLALLVFGSLSDYLGRRRVIAVALAAGAGACGLFLAAHDVGLLFAARALQGAAVGVATSAAGAALIDLQPGRSGRGPVVTSAAALLGLGAGGLGTSALVQYAPAPTRRRRVIQRSARRRRVAGHRFPRRCTPSWRTCGCRRTVAGHPEPWLVT
jgi:MFS family permease